MMKAYFVVVLYDADKNVVQESLPSDEYPADDKIAFGLDYKDVVYAQVEKRYKLVD